jgi:hypothetical protein
MALIALFQQPDEDLPALMIVDEPELGLHPYAIEIITGLIRAASLKTQVVLTTQSTTFLDHFEPEEIIVVDCEAGHSLFRRLEREPLKDWLEDYSVSELWEKNVLGGGPLPWDNSACFAKVRPNKPFATKSCPRTYVESVEEAFGSDIADPRFIPYLQLHEYETILFTDPEAFRIAFENCDREVARLNAIAESFSSIEHINDGEATAPSKRIIDVIPTYKGLKTSAGPDIAEYIGLTAIRGKCFHFNAWLTKLEGLWK